MAVGYRLPAGGLPSAAKALLVPENIREGVHIKGGGVDVTGSFTGAVGGWLAMFNPGDYRGMAFAGATYSSNKLTVTKAGSYAIYFAGHNETQGRVGYVNKNGSAILSVELSGTRYGHTTVSAKAGDYFSLSVNAGANWGMSALIICTDGL